MLSDLRDFEDGAVIDAELCIVGAGAAGITLARQFLNTRHAVVLLESGGADYEAETQALYEGPNLGMEYYELADSRLRFFGGTTAIWGGRTVPLDEMDFEKRDWVPWSGWPIRREQLDPWYRQAHTLLELGEFEYGDALQRCLGGALPAFDPTLVRASFWRFDLQKDRFNLHRCRDLTGAPNIRVLLHATAVHLQAGRDASALEEIRLAAPGGRRATVRARRYVLACGGIENPRLLLAANDVEPAGIGNAAGHVGRFFMEHPHGRAGRILARDPFALWNLFRRYSDAGTPVALALRPGEKLQREASTLNCALTVKLQREPELGLALNKRLYQELKHELAPDRTGRRLWRSYRDARAAASSLVRPLLERVRARLGMRRAYLIVRGEQAPNPDSRVVLVNDRDALGVPRAALDWRLSPQDKRSVAAITRVLDGELRRLGVGHVEPAAWLAEERPEWPVDPTVSNHPIGGYHHMGTTRMSVRPERGVVDADCRVHGYANLYVAGSSVFPTGGWANPTLTILALALRLGTHLREQAGRPA
jgi:choline dehydrogenase-like flavoprotein